MSAYLKEIDHQLHALAKRLHGYQVDMKHTQARMFRWNAIRQTKRYGGQDVRRGRGILRNYCEGGMTHILTLRKKMKGIRTSVIALNAIKKEAKT